MARRPYSTACRFFKDSDVEVQIKWYPCVEPVECLPFPSKINSLDWSSFPELAEGVGEVYGSPRTYNGAKAIPYAHGLTPCKPAEVFHDGEHYDPTAPPQKYDEKGFPLCCLDRFVSTGGLLWGGEAVVTTAVPAGPDGNCLTTTLVFGTWYLATIPLGSGGAHNWYWNATPGVTYRIRSQFISNGGFGSFTGAMRQANCSFPPITIATNNNPSGNALLDVTHVMEAGFTVLAIDLNCFSSTLPAQALIRIDHIP